ncbi:MAG: RluA family pseudouridine synthase [Planctomycetes bacterium]|nr:RluA family pseudouridine synthase [Planctomycetota bacterium]
MSALDVLFSDNHLLAVAKPAGVPTVADDSGDESLQELAKEFVRREKAKPGNVFLGVVHRLDRPVSGLVLFARTSKAAERLSEAFRERRVVKRYLALAERMPNRREGELEQWLIKDERTNVVRAVATERPEAQLAVTRFAVVREFDFEGARRTLVELEPLTGRSHQLRVALATLGAPLLGDLKYGARAPLADQSVALHARGLTVPHPVGGRELALECLPPDRAWWAAALRD